MNRFLPELYMDNGEDRGTPDPFLLFVCFYCPFFTVQREKKEVPLFIFNRILPCLIGSCLGRVTYFALTACFLVLSIWFMLCFIDSFPIMAEGFKIDGITLFEIRKTYHRTPWIICQPLNQLLLWNAKKKITIFYFFFINLIFF